MVGCEGKMENIEIQTETESFVALEKDEIVTSKHKVEQLSWENENSYPDISLLGPIARLLGISLDTLFSFQEELTTEELLPEAPVLKATIGDNVQEAGENVRLDRPWR